MRGDGTPLRVRAEVRTAGTEIGKQGNGVRFSRLEKYWMAGEHEIFTAYGSPFSELLKARLVQK